jgi:lipooligosaccharide transport system ATP-binding protein
MKRRLTLARALVNDPEVIFLDEPTTGLDPQARHLIWQRLRELTARGKTMVLTTHYMEEAERLCHRLAVMDNGRIISSGSPRELIAEHQQVVEVFGEPWAQSHAAHAQRFGQRRIDFATLEAQRCCKVHNIRVRYLHRPANLEDVF